MTVKTHFSDDKKVVTISIEGSFDFSLYQSFREAYSEIDIIGLQVILDLSKTDHVDSSALGMILLLKDHTDELSGALTIQKPNATVRQILNIAQFDKLMKINN